MSFPHAIFELCIVCYSQKLENIGFLTTARRVDIIVRPAKLVVLALKVYFVTLSSQRL
jgi:hypothetical protein